MNIRAVRTIAVEDWLNQLVRRDGRPMAPSTKAKIRNLMSVLFNHAIRYEWLEQGKNPMVANRQQHDGCKSDGGPCAEPRRDSRRHRKNDPKSSSEFTNADERRETMC